MAQYDELTGLLRELLTNRFSPKPRYVRGVLGDGLGNVVVPDRPDKSYARFSKNSTTFFEIFNRTVNPVNNWPILIGELPWQPGLTQVVDTDWSTFEQTGWGDTLGNTSPHAPTHEWPDGAPGSDAVSVHPRAIVPGRAFLSDSTPTVVYVNSFEYGTTGTLWPGLPGVDLQPLMSATVTGTMRYAGVYVDESTNSLGVVTGGTTVYTSALEPPRVGFPETGAIPIARVRVYGGQAALTEADIKDARRLWGSTGTGISWPYDKIITVSATNPAADYTTIQGALNAATNNTAILIDPGTYSEALTIDVGVALVGYGGQASILGQLTIDGISNPYLVTLDGISITDDGTGAVQDAVNGYCVKTTNCDSKTYQFLNCRFSCSRGTDISDLWLTSGDGEMYNCDLRLGTFAATTAYMLRLDGGSLIDIGSTYLTTGATDFLIDAGDTLTLVGSKTDNGNYTGAGTLTGYFLDDAGALHVAGGDIRITAGSGVTGDYHADRVTNTSGGAVAAGDVGYIDSAGEFKTTTTANLNASWAVVVVGGANSADIYVARRGRVTVNYTGSDPAQGDYLVTSTSAGDAQAQTTMRPEIFAVCLAAGSGGQVEALLLCNTIPVDVTTSQVIARPAANISGTDFVATIATLPGGATLTYNAPSSGTEDNLPPSNTGNLGKIRLWNTTRSTSALISDCNTGTNTITLTANVPAGWQVNDTITIRSQTNTNVYLSAYYVEYQITSTEIPTLARSVDFEIGYFDSTSVALPQRCILHPHLAFNAAARRIDEPAVAGKFLYRMAPTPLIDRTFTLQATASGAGTSLYIISAFRANVAAP